MNQADSVRGWFESEELDGVRCVLGGARGICLLPLIRG